MTKNLNFRLAKISDARELLSIYAPYVENTNITFEYEVPTINEFEARIAKVLKKYPYIVAEKNEKIIGYTYATTFRERVAYNWGLETTIYLSPEAKGQNIGKHLYQKLEAILKLQNITNLVASITYPNPASISFHEKYGYKKIAHFTKCGYKKDTWYDMIFMEKMINEHTIPAPEIIYLPDLKSELVDRILND